MASIVSNGNVTQNTLKFNPNGGNPIFSCYAPNSTQLDVCLFRRTELSDYPAEQTFELAAGWNWWSTYLDITLEQLEEALGSNGISIISQEGKTANYSSYGWGGNLNAIEIGQM